MPLVPCRECGAEISPNAFTCPQCGAPAPAAHARPAWQRGLNSATGVVFWLAAALFLLVVVWAAAGVVYSVVR